MKTIKACKTPLLKWFIENENELIYENVEFEEHLLKNLILAAGIYSLHYLKIS